MVHDFKVEPAHRMNPGVIVTDDGVIFSVVFRRREPCGFVLYHKKDGTSINVPFTDEHRFGSLYSAKVSPLNPEDWCYRLFSGDDLFTDPCARSLVRTDGGEEEIPAGGFFYRPDDRFVSRRTARLTRGGDEIIYCLHVRGFTMLCEGLESFPGTFSAAAERIGYLKDLGVTAVELMPIYEIQPVTRKEKGPRTMQDALALYPVSKDGLPIRDLSVPRENYWGYGRGFYYAPRAAFSTPGREGGAQKELSDMVEKFHEAGISVYLQLYFPSSVTSQQQIDIARFYVTHYAVDGFRLMGSVADIRAFTTDPLLSDVRIFHDGFPYSEIEGIDADNPESGAVSTENLFDHSDRFSRLIRRFCKSDDYVMREFLHEFLKVPEGHGSVHYICSSDGFTLRDLVSYTEKHNEANGEGGADGPADNYSWNCGAEGETDREDVLALRRSQIRNFLTLLFLSQGTPLLMAGDECFNSQDGNNNPYCQDNRLGWTEWENGADGEMVRGFTSGIIRFRRQHPVFAGTRSFKNMDSIACGYPDLSLHGKEAWKPDLGSFSHAIGICFCENYVRPSDRTELLYLAVNMHWETQELGLPKLAPDRRWNLVLDTAREDSFMEGECIPDEQHVAVVAPRSIRIFNTVTSDKPVKPRKKAVKAANAESAEETTRVSAENDTEGAAAAPESGGAMTDRKDTNEKE